nr:immunoglobulin heavy chain junction region [Macaca mulatta]
CATDRYLLLPSYW